MKPLVVLTLLLFAQDTGLGGPGQRWRNIDHTPGFPAWRQLLQRHVDKTAKHRVNHFCGIVGLNSVDSPPYPIFAYFYWPEQHIIELLGASDDPVMHEILFASGPIDLDRDIINPKEAVNLDSNAVTQDWVDRLIKRCRKDGTQITIIKRSRL